MTNQQPPDDGSDSEEQLLRLSGDRIFSLSRRLANSEAELTTLRAQIESLRDSLDDTRRMRDLLASQVESLLRERDRDYDERAQLRQLLAAAHSHIQVLLPRAFASAKSPEMLFPIGRVLPQRGSTRN